MPAQRAVSRGLTDGLPAVIDPHCRFLVLGSLPGAESLRRQQYYAHPRNSFWPLIGEVCGFSPALAYPDRLCALLASKVALWDVLANGQRAGSLDAAIVLSSAQVNRFEGVLDALPALQRILFNGALAERLFVQRVLPGLPRHQQHIARLRLPSTSPANAAVASDQKLAAWRSALALPLSAAQRQG